MVWDVSVEPVVYETRIQLVRAMGYGNIRDFLILVSARAQESHFPP